MNKNLTKIAALSVSLAMAIGVGVALSVKKASARAVKAADATDTYVFTTKSWTAKKDGSDSNWTSNKDGVGFTNNGIQVTSAGTGAKGTTVSTYANVKSVVLTYNTNKSAGAGSFDVAVGTNTAKNVSWAFSGSADGRSANFTATVDYSSSPETGTVSVTINTTTNSCYLVSCAITYDASAPVLKTMRIQNNTHAVGPYVADVTDAEDFRTLLAWDVDGNAPIRSGCSWLVSSLNVVDYQLNADTWFYWKPHAVGKITVTCSCDGFYDATTTITVLADTPNPIQAIYSMSNGADVDVFGYYVGFMEGTGPVIMDGEYGVVLYDRNANVSTYVENETILHVTGSVSIFNGLYEIGSPLAEKACGNLPNEFTPVVYSVTGSETAEKASRKTTVTGVVKSVTPKTTAAADYTWDGSEDVTIVMTVNSTDVTVFCKKAAQTAEIGTAVMDAYSSQDEITFKGFTSWNNTFQVAMNGVVEPQQDYTAEQFAQDLLDQTDAICTGWTEGTNNHDALVLVWNDLASNEKYPSLPQAQKDILANADRDPEGTVVEQAMARYDFLTGKYGLTNFINGRTPVSVHVAGYEFANENNGNTMIIIVSVIAAVSALSIGALLVIKKRKHN